MKSAEMFLQLEEMFTKADYVGICSWFRLLRDRKGNFNHLDRWLPDHQIALDLAKTMRSFLVWNIHTLKRVKNVLRTPPDHL